MIDITQRLHAQNLAEAGMPLTTVATKLGIPRKTLQRWSSADHWKTPARIRQAFKDGGLASKLSGWMAADPLGGLKARLFYDYLAKGLATDPDALWARMDSEAVALSANFVQPHGSPFPILKNSLLTAQMNMCQDVAADVDLGQTDTPTVRQNVTVVENEADLGENEADLGENEAGAENVGNPEHTKTQPPHTNSPESPQNPHKLPYSARQSGDVAHNVPGIENVSPAHTLHTTPEVEMSPGPREMADFFEERRRTATPVLDSVPTIGKFQRPSTITELLPADFEDSIQIIRDAEAMAAVETVRGLAYRENISATLLKLSQYARDLADTQPREALLMMGQISRLDSTGAKRFRLDEAAESKTSEQLRKVSAREEDGVEIVLE